MVTRRILTVGMLLAGLAVLVLASVSSAWAQSPSGLVDRYSFNDGTANDSVGSYNGTLVNGATVSGGAVNLNGAGQYVSLGGIGINTMPAVTFEAWGTYNPGTGGWSRIFDFGNTDGGGAGFNYIGGVVSANGVGGPARAIFSNTDPGYLQETDAYAPSTLATGTQVYTAITFDNSTNLLSIYVNGALVGTNTPQAGLNLTSVSNVLGYLGKSLYNGDSYLTGSIDEFRVWNTALPASTIATHELAGANAFQVATWNGTGDFFANSNNWDVGVPNDPVNTAIVVSSGSLTVSTDTTNNYIGTTILSGGTMSVSADTQLGALAGEITLNGGVLQIAGASFNTTSRQINLGNNGGGFDIQNAANTFSINQVLGGPGGLTKSGPGALALNAANIYSGGTTITGGTVAAGATNALGSGPLSMANGAVLDLNNNNVAVGTLSGSGTITNSGNGSQTFTTTVTTDSTFSGVIQNGNGVTYFAMYGPNALTLSGPNNYTGQTNIHGGTINLPAGGILGDQTNTNITYIAPNAGDTAAVNLSGGTLAGSLVRIGENGNGTVTQTAGLLVSGNWFNVGGNGTGLYNFSGGTAINNGNAMEVPTWNGTGTVNMSGNAVLNANAAGLWMASQTVGGHGYFNQGGQSVVNVNGTLDVGRNGTAVYSQSDSSTLTVTGAPLIVGDFNGANGAYIQSGNAIVNVTTDNLLIGNNSGATGVYTLQSGTLNTGDIRPGVGGTGTYNQTGGVANARWWFRVGELAGSSGTANISGGILNIGNNNGMHLNIGEGGTGTMNISNGQVTVGGPVSVGGQSWDNQPSGTGYLNMSGNSSLTVTTGDWFMLGTNGGTATMTIGGNASVTNTSTNTDPVFIVGNNGVATLTQSGNSSINTGPGEFWVGQASGGTGTYNMSGGSLTIGNWIAVGRAGGTGSVNMSGGTINKQGGGNIIVGSLGGNGTWNMNGGMVLNNGALVLGENSNSGTMYLSGGTVQATGVTSFINPAPNNTALGYLYFNGGVLQATVSNGNFLTNSGGDYIQAGGAIIDTNGNNVTINAALAPDPQLAISGGTDGGLTKQGAGWLILTNAGNSYAGGTTINGGLLQVASDAMLGAVPANPQVNITINNGGELYNNGGQLTLSTNRNVYLGAGTQYIQPGWGPSGVAVNGQVSGPGGLGVAWDGGVLTLNNSNSYQGSTTIGTTAGPFYWNSGAANVTLRLGNNNALPGGDLIFGSDANNNTATLDLNGFSATVGALSGGGNAIVDNFGGNNLTLTVGNHNASSTFSGSIRNSTGTLALNKIGAGMLVLSGANTYGGGTTVSGGALQVANANAVLGPLSVGNGATLNVSAPANTGLAWVYYGNTPGDQGIYAGPLAGIQSVVSTVPPTSITNVASLGTLPFATPQYVQAIGSGMLDIAHSGSYTFTRNATDDDAAIFIDGQAVVPGVATSFGNPWGINGSSTITLSAGMHNIAVAWYQGFGGESLDVQWSGPDTGNSLVDLTTTTANLTPDLYVPNLSGAGNVALTTGNLVVGYDGTSTTFGGTISGIGGVNKWGGGTLLLSGTNTYTGSTTIIGSTLQLGTGASGQDGSIGSTSGVTNNAALVYNLFGSQTASYVIGGTGSLTKTGPGTLVLAGANTYSGPTAISGGVLSVGIIDVGGNPSGIGLSSSAASNLVIDGGTLQYTGSGATTDRLFKIGGNTGSATIDASGSGPLVFSNNGVLDTFAITNGNYGSITLQGSSTAANRFAPSIQDPSGGGYSTSLAKSGPGTWVLTGQSYYTGPTTVNAGKLVFATGSSVDETAITVATGAVLAAQPGGGTMSTTTQSGVVGASLNLQHGSTFDMTEGATAVGIFNLAAGNPTTGTSLTLGDGSGGATLNFDLSSTGADQLLASWGAASVSGTNYIGITPLGGSLSTSGTYAVISVPGGGLNPADFALSSSTVQAGANSYILHLTGNGNEEEVYATLPNTGPSVWQGGSGHWNSSITASWVNGAVPNSAGAGAVFNQTSGSTSTITLDSPQTVGTIVLGDSTGSSSPTSYLLTGSTLTMNNNGNGATITVANGSHEIDAMTVVLADSAGLTVSGSGTLAFGSSSSITDLGQSYALTLNAPGGTLILSSSDSYTGGTVVEAGTLIATTNTALADGSSLTVGAGGTFIFDPTVTGSAMDAASLNAASAMVAPVPEPGTVLLLLTALWSAAIYRRFSSRRKAFTARR